MTTLILMRHGQASLGASNYDQLSERGEEQARASTQFFVDRYPTFSRVLCGPGQRHRQTARLALQGLEMPPVEIVPELDEFADASLLLRAAEKRTGLPLSTDQKLSKSELMRHYYHQVMLWGEDQQRMDGIVVVNEFRHRVASVLDSVLDINEPSRRVLAVTSGGVIATMFSEVFALSNRDMAKLMSSWSIDNCSLTAISCSEQGRVLRFYNQTAHLPAEMLTSV